MEVRKGRRGGGRRERRRVRSPGSRAGEDGQLCEKLWFLTEKAGKAALVLGTVQDCGAGAQPSLHQGG